MGGGVFSWVCKMWIGLGKGNFLREIKTGEKRGGGGGGGGGVVPPRDRPVWNRSKLL